MLTGISLFLTIACLFVLDYGITSKTRQQLSVSAVLLITAFWTAITIAVCLLVYLLSNQDDTGGFTPATADFSIVSEFLSIYLSDKLLNIDLLIVIALVFTELNIPIQLQLRILMVGLLIAFFIRAIFIALGVYLLGYADWIYYLLGSLLLISSIKYLIDQRLEIPAQSQKLKQKLQNHMTVKDSIENNKFVSLKKKNRYVTPMFIALLLIETTFLGSAVDSVPVAISLSDNIYVILTASLLSMLGIRILYYLVVAARHRFQTLRLSIFLVLIFLAIKMLIQPTITIPAEMTLLILAGITGFGILLSVLKNKQTADIEAKQSSLIRGLLHIHNLTFSTLERISIILVGTIVLIIGIIMIVTPGPAIIFIPAGLAILAIEFNWANQLSKIFWQKIKQAKRYIKRNKDHDDLS